MQGSDAYEGMPRSEMSRIWGWDSRKAPSPCRAYNIHSNSAALGTDDTSREAMSLLRDRTSERSGRKGNDEAETSGGKCTEVGGSRTHTQVGRDSQMIFPAR